MTLNIISDIHCDYNWKKKEVVWNRTPKKNLQTYKEITDEEYVESYKKEQKECLDKFLEKISKTSNIDDFHPKYKNKWKFFKIKNLFTKKEQVIECIQHLKDVMDGKRKFYKEAINDCSRILFYEDELSTFSKDYGRSLTFQVIKVFLRYQCDFVPEKLKKADYLIVAGDLGHDQSYNVIYNDLKERTKHLFKNVFFIKGNHDYWWFPKNDGSQSMMTDLPFDINLEHRYVEEQLDENTILLGCTMWAPVSERDRWAVVTGMNDFRYIPRFSYERVNQLYREESNWLRYKVQANKDKKIIIVTHHIPLKELISESYKHSEVNAAYAVLDGSCNDIKPNLWISGHSHEYSDKTIDGVRYIRNPIGYREFYGYLPSECEPTHWYNTIVEV